ncbi:MAG: hypothetical protein N838_22350 [Thiohalocapsa sp. PB-PSB1]|nr:MAG: hypothetical protein N838_22350 [Thiohalocapsa sp. PB-PSB1]
MSRDAGVAFHGDACSKNSCSGADVLLPFLLFVIIIAVVVIAHRGLSIIDEDHDYDNDCKRSRDFRSRALAAWYGWLSWGQLALMRHNSAPLCRMWRSGD